MNEVWLGDCLDLMPRIPDESVDMILCDLSLTYPLSWFENRAKNNLTQQEWDAVKRNIRLYLVEEGR